MPGRDENSVKFVSSPVRGNGSRFYSELVTPKRDFQPLQPCHRVPWRFVGTRGKHTVLELMRMNLLNIPAFLLLTISFAGAFTDAEMRQHLAKRGVSGRQIEMGKAQEAPELNVQR